MKFDKLKVGMTLYTVQSTKVGNTTLRTLATYQSTVQEIDKENRRALISWNCNPASWRSEFSLSAYKGTRPVLVKTRFGYRRPTREELAEIRAKTKAEALLKAGK